MVENRSNLIMKNDDFFHFKKYFALENTVLTHVYTLSESNFRVESFAHTLRSNKATGHVQNPTFLTQDALNIVVRSSSLAVLHANERRLLVARLMRRVGRDMV